MSFNVSKNLPLLACLLAFFSMNSSSEIYHWVDAKGRQQFSDSPRESHSSEGYDSRVDHSPSHSLKGYGTFVKSSEKSQTPKELERIAKKIKKDRIKRERLRAKAKRLRVKKNKKREKQLAAAKKRKQACQTAKNKEDAAFRKRTQRQGLSQMRKALSNYEKRREIRREKCS